MSSSNMETRWISHIDLESSLKRGDAMVIDVREIDFFVGHIPGARNVPASIFADAVSDIAEELFITKKLCVVHCFNGEARATACAIQLSKCLDEKRPGQEINVHVLKGGFATWEKHFAEKKDAGRYISRRLCLDQYTSNGFPDKVSGRPEKKARKPKQKVKFSTWHAGEPASSTASSSAWPASTNGSPLPDEFLRRQTEPPQSSAAQSTPTQISETLPEAAPMVVEDVFRGEAGYNGSTPSAAVSQEADVKRACEPTDECQGKRDPAQSGEEDDSNAVSDPGVVPRRRSDAWRGWLSVGDKVQIHSRGEKKWFSGVILALCGTKVKVNYFQGTKVRLKIISLDSPDLQPEISSTDVPRVPASSISSASSDVGSDMLSEAGTISDMQSDVGTFSCASGRSTSSLKAHLVSSAHVWSSTASIASVAQFPSGRFSGTASSKGESSIATSSYGGSSTTSSVCGSELPDVPFMSQIDLARRLGKDTLQVIDVRDIDYFTGHVSGARHSPFSFFEEHLEELANEFAGSGKTLVFHCADSKRRGPWCARRFASYLEDNCANANCEIYILRGGFQGWVDCCSGSDNIGDYIQVPGLSSAAFQRCALNLFSIPSEDALPSF